MGAAIVTPPEKELIISRVINGFARLNFSYQNRAFALYYKRPSIEQFYTAHELYNEIYNMAVFDGLFTTDELRQLIVRLGYWGKDKDKELEKFSKDIDDFKVKLYELIYRPTEFTKVKKLIAMARANYTRLSDLKDSLSYLSCEGYANVIRSRYLIGVSLYSDLKTPLFKEDAQFWNSDSQFLELATSNYVGSKITEAQFREVCRTEPWRSFWACSKDAPHLFGKPIVDFTEEQRELSLWSSLYDSVYEHSDSPNDKVIADDDALDGWIIHHKRLRDKNKNEQKLDNSLSDKMKKAQELYIPVGSREEAQEIEDLNDAHAKRIKQQRLNYLHKKGEVDELEMPDTRKRLAMEASQKLLQAFKK